MKTIKAVPGSFRDPSGRVYEVGERIFRTVNPSFAEEYEFVHASGLMRRLAEEDRALLDEDREPSEKTGKREEREALALERPQHAREPCQGEDHRRGDDAQPVCGSRGPLQNAGEGGEIGNRLGDDRVRLPRDHAGDPKRLEL